MSHARPPIRLQRSGTADSDYPASGARTAEHAVDGVEKHAHVDLPELGLAADHIADLLQAHPSLAAPTVDANFCWSFAANKIPVTFALMAVEGHLEQDHEPLQFHNAFLANDLPRLAKIAAKRGAARRLAVLRDEEAWQLRSIRQGVGFAHRARGCAPHGRRAHAGAVPQSELY
jgi:hypothetical protein